MSRTLIGISTFGNLDFTRLAVQSIRDTVKKHQVQVMLVVGKPDDQETVEYGMDYADQVHRHHRNMGFPVAINDIYDAAWKHADYDNVIIIGNDVIAYPGCIDGMIDMAATGRFDMVSATMYDVQSLLRDHPDAAHYFEGPNHVFTDFDADPWNLHTPRTEYGEEPGALKDIRNMALFTKGAFAKLGYADVNFFPNGYYEDNDYARRGVNAGIRACGAPHCEFFHFWSRTIHQGPQRPHNVFFERNRDYYLSKWGGEFGHETKNAPVHIGSRENEEEIVKLWSR